MEADTFNNNMEYECCPGIKCGGFTELMYLVTHCQKIDNYEEKIINWLYHNESKINATNELGWTALMLACCNSNTRVVKLLLDCFANPNIQNNNLDTALILACKYINICSNIEIIELLANYNIDENSYIFLVQKAFKTYDKDLLRQILFPKTDLNKQNKKGDSALITIIEYADNANATIGVKLLLENGANINDVDKNLESALHIAVQKYNSDCTLIKILLENGINVNLQNKNGMTALVKYLYTEKKSFEYDPQLVKLLLKFGTNPNIYGKYHNLIANPLFIFCGKRFDDLEMINLLLDKGADINSQGINKSLLSGVINYYVQCHIYKWEIDNVHQMIILLLERGADPNIIDNNKNNIDNIQNLFKFGADPNILDIKNNNALIFAIKNRFSLEVINLLIAEGINIHIINNENKTALMYAVEHIKFDYEYCHQLVNLLLDHDINTNITNLNGQTALITALDFINKSDIMMEPSYLFGTDGIITRLMERTNYSIVDNHGKTILSYLRKDITLNFIKLFEKVCVRKSVISNIQQSILDTHLTIVMRPSSIRTRLLTMHWYYNHGHTFQQIVDLDKSLLDYFGIYDEESLEKKLQENIKNI
ncbi:putative ankyrin repeat protein [Megavirus courdo7]|uniref:Putative ankyrin repeat protein n=1 Tax=Megavirus courdo7 TaxID=1128135 RepID=H2EC83_9VIRU|nr:putative ankyrin repeat protein [Megavirus courdo7]